MSRATGLSRSAEISAYQFNTPKNQLSQKKKNQYVGKIVTENILCFGAIFKSTTSCQKR